MVGAVRRRAAGRVVEIRDRLARRAGDAVARLPGPEVLLFFLVNRMNPQNLAQIRDCVAHGDRAAALRVVRSAIVAEKIGAHDGIELMLALRQGSPDKVMEAME